MKSYIVVGSGILGASTAYHLAKAGANVTIMDRQQLGQATDAKKRYSMSMAFTTS